MQSDGIDDCIATKSVKIETEVTDDECPAEKPSAHEWQERSYGAEEAEKARFIQQCPLLRQWGPKLRKLLEGYLIKETYDMNAVLLRQGDPVKGIYFIHRGQAKILVNPELHKEQFPTVFKSGTADNHNGYARENASDTTQQTHVRVRRRHGYAAAEKRLQQKSMALCCVDENDVVGDIEFIFDLGRYTQTVICTCASDVYILESSCFDKLFNRRSQRTLDRLRNTVLDKLRSRSARAHGAFGVELYSRLLAKAPPTNGHVRARSSSPATPKCHPKDASASTMTERINDKNLMLQQLVTLFLDNRAPLIEPSVPGSLYYRTKSIERAGRPVNIRRTRRAKDTRRVMTNMSQTALSPTVSEGRLRSAMRSVAKPARSRRALQMLAMPKDRGANRAIRPHTASGASRTDNRTGATIANLKARPSSAASLPEKRRIFRLTEDLQFRNGGDGDEDDDDEEEDGDEIVSLRGIATNLDEMHQAQTASRAKVVCSMLERKANEKTALLPTSMVTWGRNSHDEYDEEEEEAFDWETSESALAQLEGKLRQFHSKQDDCGSSKMTPQIAELKRFSIEGPEDVPIPGGTVYIRQKPCKYSPDTYVNPEFHQHVRRFMIPKESFSIAKRSVLSHGARRLKSAQPSINSIYASDIRARRPTTAPVSQRNDIAAAGWAY